MATHFTQDAVLRFLQSHGGSVKNADMLLHFKDYIREHPDRDRNRELFKKFVNSVALVRQIEGVTHIILRNRFKGGPALSPAPPRRSEGSKPGNIAEIPGLSPAATSDGPRQRAGQEELLAAPATLRAPGREALPAVGLLPPNNRPQVRIDHRQPGGTRPAQGGPERGPPAGPERGILAGTERTVPSPEREALVGPGRGRGAMAGPARGIGAPAGPERGSPAGPERSVPGPEREALAGPGRGTPAGPNSGALVDPEKGTPTSTERGIQEGQARRSPGGIERQALGDPGRGRRTPAGPGRDIPADTGRRVPGPEIGALAGSGRGRGLPVGPERGPPVGPERGPPVGPERGPPVGPVRGPPVGPDRGPPAGPERGALAGSGRGRGVQGPERVAPASPEKGTPRGPSFSPNSSLSPARPPPGVTVGSPPGGGVTVGSPPGGRHKEPSLQTPVQEPIKGTRGHLQQQNGAQQECSPHPQALLPEQGVRRNFKHRKSYKSAVSQDDDDEEYEEEIQMRGVSKRGVWPLSDVERAAFKPPQSTVDTVAPSSVSSSGKGPPQIYIHSTGQTPTSWGPPGVWPAGQVRPVSCESTSTRRSLPLGAESQSALAQRSDRIKLHSGPAGPDNRHRLSPSHSSSAGISSDAQISSSDHSPHSSSRGSHCSSSSEDLQARADGPGTATELQDTFQNSQRSSLKPESYTSRSKGAPAWHSSAGNLCDDHKSMDNLPDHHRSTDFLHKEERFPNQHTPWFFSTGDLCDNPEEAYSSEGSSSSPKLRQRSAAVNRVDSTLRNRMCLSLGADLDQIQQMDPTGNEAARLVRLKRISSNLILHRNLSSSSLSSCPTPPRSGSPVPVVDNEGQKGGNGKSSAATNASTGPTNGQQYTIPLDPREHSWMVKAASGSWADIYSMFRENPSLLNKRDFISGFTVLHWIAKHGDHRVLNTLWYGVSKAGLSFNINAKSTAGQTPLHIAAIYNSKNIMSLLVKSFFADVKLRDTAGKRPWQYLQNPSQEMLELLGAQQWAAELNQLKKQGENASQPQKQRSHVRHNFSFASPKQRPLTYIGMTKVKRSTSLAAFLKNRSQPFDWHKSESSA